MACKDRTYLCFFLLILFSVIVISAGQNFWKITQNEVKTEEKAIKIIWCTISREEKQKCRNFAMANERDQIRVGHDIFKIECYQAMNKDECMLLLDQGKATLTSMDAAEVFVGGRYNSLIPIAQEILAGGLNHYFAVAAIKKGSLTDVQNLFDLRGRRACFAGVETFAGWVLPIYTLMNEGGLEIIDCNNHVRSATRYFGPSCAVNCLTDKYNPIGDNSDKLCQLCIGKIPGGRCTSADPYAGFEGAFRCLLEAGEIAFLKHTTIPELVSGDEFTSISKDSFELLCKDGSRKPVDDYLACNWGKVPSNAIVTSSASSFKRRVILQKFLEKAVRIYNSTKVQSRDYYERDERPQFDQFGNPINRFKRQDFNYHDQNRPNDQNRPRDNYNDPNRPRDNHNEQNPSRNNYNGDNRQNTNHYDAFGQPDNNNYENNGRQPNNNDPFARDPFSINRDQFGENIDPYVDGSYNRNPALQYNNTYPSDTNYRNNNTFFEIFSLFESSPRYGIHSNLLFQDSTTTIEPLNENQQTYSGFLGQSLNVIMGLRECQVYKMTMCVTSDAEKDKCVKMRTALKAQLLKPEMECYKGHSQIHCMQAIRSGIADVAVFDASDVYTAGLNFELVPFISEMYNLNEPEYYVVAVAKESDPSTELTYLRGKNTCHGGINTAAGWVYPLAFLISNGWIRPYGCNSIRAAAEYFTKSCVPGAISTEYNTGVPYDNMCDLCHGASYRYCRRDASEDYYGHTGAFRCLVEGGGHVAFVKHTTVTENTGGKREEWWARDNLNDDFELLCPDGTRAEVNEYTKCNLGKVKANAVVTRGGYGYNQTHVNAFINLFLYAQTYYGRKTTDEFSFSMFSSMPPYTDLIFQDATTQLNVIPPSQRHYALYLGNDFMRARRIVDCHAGSTHLTSSFLTLMTSTILSMLLVRN